MLKHFNRSPYGDTEAQDSSILSSIFTVVWRFSDNPMVDQHHIITVKLDFCTATPVFTPIMILFHCCRSLGKRWTKSQNEDNMTKSSSLFQVDIYWKQWEHAGGLLTFFSERLSWGHNVDDIMVVFVSFVDENILTCPGKEKASHLMIATEVWNGCKQTFLLGLHIPSHFSIMSSWGN